MHYVGHKLGLPPAVALIIGGGFIAFLPGLPEVHIDPELVLVIFLPPLLMDSALGISLDHLRRHMLGVGALAIGAVLFTTTVVALVAHWLVPALPGRPARRARWSRRRMRCRPAQRCSR